MSYGIGTGISANPSSTVGNPEVTYLWSAQESGASLNVQVQFGGFGGAVNNQQTCTIPWGSTASVTLNASTPPNPAMYLTGKVSVCWGDYANSWPTSYIVTYSGNMQLNSGSSILDVASADQNGIAVDSQPIIVYAYLSGQTGGTPT